MSAHKLWLISSEFVCVYRCYCFISVFQGGMLFLPLITAARHLLLSHTHTVEEANLLFSVYLES